MATKAPPTGKSQIQKFRDLARELETDDDDARFAETVKRLAKTPREAKPTPRADKSK